MKGKEIILSVGKEGKKREKIRKEMRIKSSRFYVSMQKLYIFLSVDTNTCDRVHHFLYSLMSS